MKSVLMFYCLAALYLHLYCAHAKINYNKNYNNHSQYVPRYQSSFANYFGFGNDSARDKDNKMSIPRKEYVVNQPEPDRVFSNPLINFRTTIPWAAGIAGQGLLFLQALCTATGTPIWLPIFITPLFLLAIAVIFVPNFNGVNTIFPFFLKDAEVFKEFDESFLTKKFWTDLM